MRVTSDNLNSPKCLNYNLLSNNENTKSFQKLTQINLEYKDD